MARLRIAIGVLVSLMWSLSVLADMSLADYEVSPLIHMAMMTVVGALFGNELLKRNGGKA